MGKFLSVLSAYLTTLWYTYLERGLGAKPVKWHPHGSQLYCSPKFVGIMVVGIVAVGRVTLNTASDYRAVVIGSCTNH